MFQKSIKTLFYNVIKLLTKRPLMVLFVFVAPVTVVVDDDVDGVVDVDADDVVVVAFVVIV